MEDNLETLHILLEESTILNEYKGFQEKKDTEKCLQQFNAQIIGFMSGKGGVGKTGLAINVANFCAENGAKVLLIDCDIGTNGATMFFCLNEQIRKKLRTFNAVVNFQDILADLLNEEALGITIDSSEATPITIKNNFDFIPAGVDKNVFDEQEFTAPFLLRFEEKLEQYFSIWRKKYDLIIMDFGAGEGKINSLLAKVSDNICIVMHPDEISRQAVRRKLRFLFREYNLDDIMCCVNMIKKDNYISNVGILINEFTGFQYSADYAALFEKGMMIEIAENTLCKQLSSVVKNICQENRVVVQYERKIEKQRLALEEEKKKKRAEKEQKKKIIKFIRLIIAGVIAGVTILTILIFTIYRVNIAF